MAKAAASFGFMTMAFGPDKYAKQASALAASLRLHMPGIPIAIVGDREFGQDLFDLSIPMPRVEKAGTLHKKDMYEFSPFDETLFIDSDCLVSRPFWDELSEIRKFHFSPIVNKYTGKDGFDLYIENMETALCGVKSDYFPKFNGGVYFFRKGNYSNRIFKESEDILKRRVELGIKNFDNSGPGEETLIGLALASLGIRELYDDRGRLMRTPLNMSGRLSFDVLGGGCKFEKEGNIVTPAICHFCGPWAESAVYKLSVYSIENLRRPPLHKKITAHCMEHIRSLKFRALRKWNHLKGTRPGASQ